MKDLDIQLGLSSSHRKLTANLWGCCKRGNGCLLKVQSQSPLEAVDSVLQWLMEGLNRTMLMPFPPAPIPVRASDTASRDRGQTDMGMEGCMTSRDWQLLMCQCWRAAKKRMWGQHLLDGSAHWCYELLLFSGLTKGWRTALDSLHLSHHCSHHSTVVRSGFM